MNREHLDALSAKLAALPGAPRSRLELRVRWFLASVVAIANAAGAAVVLVFTLQVIPDPENVPDEATWVNLIAFLSYPFIAGPVAIWWGLKVFAPIRRLVREGGTPDREQRHAVLLGPARITLIQAVLWGVGAIGWTALNAFYGPLMALKMGMTCLLGAITTIGLVYLLAERLLRPAAALVLATQPPREHAFSRVTTRTLLAWALGTAVPLLGVIVVAIVALSDVRFERHEVALTVLVLGVTALLISFEVTFVAIRAIGDPIQSVRQGMARVARGDLEASIEVYDASELGQLQAGFNSMVTGLRAHERLQDLFSRQVGPDVARLALDSEISLGGEVKDVAVMFVDLAGSTKMAAERPPDEVVALLNMFFGVVVECVNRNGGWINKFEGDAALAVWGAPVPQEDTGGRALAAARELAARLPVEIPSLTAGIGVSCGPVVAGYIGAEQRFEYTVIGDPVNEAARLSDLAKSAPSGVLANAEVLDDCDPLESFHWETSQTVTLRGRPRATLLAHPRATDSAPAVALAPAPRPRPRRLRRLGVLPLLRAKPRKLSTAPRTILARPPHHVPMDIRLTFTTPHPHTDPPTRTLEITVDRIVLDGPTLRALRKGELVTETPLSSLAHIDFPPRPRATLKTPNAYRHWTPEADAELLSLLHTGTTIEALTTHFGRGRNGILNRLLKLGAFALPAPTRPPTP